MRANSKVRCRCRMSCRRSSPAGSANKEEAFGPRTLGEGFPPSFLVFESIRLLAHTAAATASRRVVASRSAAPECHYRHREPRQQRNGGPFDAAALPLARRRPAGGGEAGPAGPQASAQVIGKLPSGRVAVARILGQGLQDYRLQVPRNRPVDLPQGPRGSLDLAMFLRDILTVGAHQLPAAVSATHTVWHPGHETSGAVIDQPVLRHQLAPGLM